MRPRLIAILGLPGAGKTRLSLALGAAMSARHWPVLVVHTDVLKVTGRQLDAAVPAGPGYREPIEARSRWMAELLGAQAQKAQRDGYSLIVEGTMALGFEWPGLIRIVLQLDEATRRARCDRKHPAAARALRSADLREYENALDQIAALRLDAALSPDALVSRCIDRVQGSNGAQ